MRRGQMAQTGRLLSEGAQNLSLLQYAFTVILTSHRVDGSIESTRRRGAFDSIAPLRRVDCLYADSILLQIESIDCSYRLDRLDLEFIQRVLGSYILETKMTVPVPNEV